MTGIPPGLLLITDRRQARRPLPEIVRAALEAGFVAVMVREPDLEARDLLSLAEGLLPPCREHHVPILVNRRLDVALAIPEAGVHLGVRGVAVEDARRLMGPDRPVGYSAHEVPGAATALAEGADYVCLSPIFPTASKPDRIPRGLPWLEEAARHLPAERVRALGGVTAESLPALRKTGIGGAAVMGDLMRSADPPRTASELVAAWRGA